MGEAGMDKAEFLGNPRLNRVDFIDLWLIDIEGRVKSVGVPTEEFASIIDNGKWFDSSSIRGCGDIEDSDKLLMPILNTFRILPWRNESGKQNAVVLCDILNSDGSPYAGDPKNCLRRVLAEAKEKDYHYIVGSEVEFFILADNGTGIAKKHTDAGDYCHYEALDDGQTMRQEICRYLKDLGIKVKALHHEVAPSQHEIAIEHADAETFAYYTYLLKLCVSRVAAEHGYQAVFSPKPFTNINGSGMHTHQSLADENGKNLFYDPAGMYNLSELAMQFLAGQLRHAEQIACIIAPTKESYKRLVPGFEAPVYACWDSKNRSAMIRVPANTSAEAPKGTRLEFRAPDPSCNPYLAYAVMLKAGLRGIGCKLKPPPPLRENAYEMSEEERENEHIRTLPISLKEALEKSGLSCRCYECNEDHLSPTIEALEPLYPTYIDLKSQNLDP